VDSEQTQDTWINEVAMKIDPALPTRRRGARWGTTLVETVISIAIVGIMIGGTVNGYILAAHRAEWSAYSLAAQSLANQRLEQARAAKWDRAAYPPVDQVVSANFPVSVDILDVPTSGMNIVYVTNYVTISTVSLNPPLKMVRVDCAWRFLNRGVFTNTIISYRAPDQ